MSEREQTIADLLSRSLEIILPGREQFEQLLRSRKKITIYHGIDPTSPSLHLGHLVPLLALRRLQDLGHRVVLLVGDFTAQIGDPTDKRSARQPLTKEQVKKNAATYKAQASAVLSFGGKNPARLAFNSTWLGKLSFADVLRLGQLITVQQLLERDMFQERMTTGKPIGVHEFLYPLMQGYDSVALGVDAELGGTDQLFNMKMGRTLSKVLTKKDKFVITVRLLQDATTGKKMSKSEGNQINLTESGEEMFGKVMALGDGMIVPVAQLATRMPSHELAELERSLVKGTLSPRDAKLTVAGWVVQTVHGERVALRARNAFETIFIRRERGGTAQPLRIAARSSLAHIVVASGVVSSMSAARRLIEQGGVSLDDTIIRDADMHVQLGATRPLLRVGKHHFFTLIQA